MKTILRRPLAEQRPARLVARRRGRSRAPGGAGRVLAPRERAAARFSAGASWDANGARLDSAVGFEGRLRNYQARSCDPEAALQFHRARCYDPTPGRWLSDEPLGREAGA